MPHEPLRLRICRLFAVAAVVAIASPPPLAAAPPPPDHTPRADHADRTTRADDTHLAWLPLLLHGPTSLIPPAPPGPRTLLVPGEFSTVRAALSTAKDRDTVLVAAGTFTETGLVVPLGVKLAGAGRARTTITGGGRGTVVTVRGGQIERLTIRGGTRDGSAAGIRIDENGAREARVADAAVVDSDIGIAIFCTGAGCRQGASIERVIVAGNRTGGIQLEANRARSTLRQNTIVDNVGVGITVLGVDIVVDRNVVAGHRVGIAASSADLSTHNVMWGNGRDYSGTGPGAGDVAADPLFRDRTARDFRLTAGSPRLDDGTVDYGALAFAPTGDPPTGLVLRTGDDPAAGLDRRWLAWDDGGAHGYAVFVGTSAGRYDRRIDVGTNAVRTGLDGTGIDLDPRTGHFAAVAAYDAEGDESVLSAEVEIPPASPPSTVTVRRVPGGYSTIAAALAASVAGDRVEVAPGTYREGTLAVKRGVHLRGSGWARTVIDGGGAGSVVEPQPESIVEGFTITGSKDVSLFDSGVWVTRGPVTLRRNRITGNRTGVYAWCFEPATCDLRVTLDGNVIDRNAGAGVNGDAQAVWSARGNTIAGNGTGGDRTNNSSSGIVIANAGSTVVDNIVVGNSFFGLGDLVGATTHHNLAARNGIDFRRTRGPDDLAADPIWRDEAGGDYRLRAGSPAIGAAEQAGRDLGALPFVPAGRAPAGVVLEPAGDFAWDARWTGRSVDATYTIYIGVVGEPGYSLALDAGIATTYRVANLPGGLTYRLAIAARNTDGDESGLSTPIPFKVESAADGHYEEDSPALARRGAWRRVDDPAASGGAYLAGDAPGDSVTLAFGGDRIALLRRIGPDGGRAVVTVDGRPHGVFEFYFPEVRHQVPTLIDGLGDGRHVLTLAVAADRHPDASGRTVALDAFGIPGPYAPSDAQRAGIDRVNLYRTRVGIPLARGAAALHLAAQAHADYAVRNPGESHGETSGKPGFIGTGPTERARYFGYPDGVWEDMHFIGDAAAAIDGFMQTVYHRIPVIRYELVEAGIGSARSGNNAADVLDMGNGGRVVAPPERRIITYPIDGQTDVPPEWDGGEGPDPLPDQPKPVGYPVSLHIAQPPGAPPAWDLDDSSVSVQPSPLPHPFWGRGWGWGPAWGLPWGSGGSRGPAWAMRPFVDSIDTLDDAWNVDALALLDDQGREVPAHKLHRDTDANKYLAADTVFLIARRPMTAGATYTAHVAGTDSRGAAFDARWSFTTAR